MPSGSPLVRGSTMPNKPWVVARRSGHSPDRARPWSRLTIHHSSTRHLRTVTKLRSSTSRSQ